MVDPLPGQQLSLLVLALHGPLRTGAAGVVLASPQVGDAVGHLSLSHGSHRVPAGGGSGGSPAEVPRVSSHGYGGQGGQGNSGPERTRPLVGGVLRVLPRPRPRGTPTGRRVGSGHGLGRGGPRVRRGRYRGNGNHRRRNPDRRRARRGSGSGPPNGDRDGPPGPRRALGRGFDARPEEHHV